MVRKRRITGAAAGCAVVLATALGTPAVGAQFSCEKCEPPGHILDPGAPDHAIVTIEGISVSETVFHKNEQGSPAFLKLNNVGPSDDVFAKIEDGGPADGLNTSSPGL